MKTYIKRLAGLFLMALPIGVPCGLLAHDAPYATVYFIAAASTAACIAACLFVGARLYHGDWG